jgi:dolichol kinase
MKHLIRCILTVILLVVIWHHAHWSVALALTLICTGLEYSVLQSRVVSQRLMVNPLIKSYLADHERRTDTGSSR